MLKNCIFYLLRVRKKFISNSVKYVMVFGISLSFPVSAQTLQVQGFVHEQSKTTEYVWPADSKVLENLDKWRDQKFGVLLHWGLYSVPGIVESWSICSEDVDWITRKGDMDYDEYKKWYWGLKDSLNPVNFNPDVWADIMKDAGMKYMVFTTKHHDGFCMFDSKYTDFSIAHGPFSTDSRKNVAWHVFDAFRKKDFMIGCYFSKPDWHCPWFWNPYFATPQRGINYKKERHPDWWMKYQEFTANQLDELTSDYGHLDILWLDGGWITGNDVNLDRILDKARERNPGLISVDRSIRGKNENYQTPERGVPNKQLDYPWESCIPLSNDWGWVPNASFKSSRKIVALLVEIVAKGGCLLLGVGPTSDGVIEESVAHRLHEVGNWLRINGEAIYGTRIVPTFHDGKVWFTGNKDGKTIYAIYTVEEGEGLPSVISWTGNLPKGKILLLQNGKSVNYKIENGKVTLQVPEGICVESLAFRFEIN